MWATAPAPVFNGGITALAASMNARPTETMKASVRTRRNDKYTGAAKNDLKLSPAQNLFSNIGIASAIRSQNKLSTRNRFRHFTQWERTFGCALHKSGVGSREPGTSVTHLGRRCAGS